jgi:hypothetical protein
MPEGQNRPFQPVEPSAHVEQTISIGSRVQRKKDAAQKDRRRRQRKTGIEESLQEEQEELDKQIPEGDGHVDYHA